MRLSIPRPLPFSRMIWAVLSCLLLSSSIAQTPETPASLTERQVNGLPSDRASVGTPAHPAIRYREQPTTDVVQAFNGRLDAGAAHLTFNEVTGYLLPTLDAFGVPKESQMLVFSKTSLQSPYIDPKTPRAIYFNDRVSVAFIRGAPLLELAVRDPQQGTIFYSIQQRRDESPRFVRNDQCLTCHLSRTAMDIPGTLLRSVVTDREGRLYPQFGNVFPDDRTPFDERWGGWYVSGKLAKKFRHLGNASLAERGNFESLSLPADLDATLRQIRASGYLSGESDVVASLVFTHQSQVGNLLTRMNWDARAARHSLPDHDHELYVRLLTNNARELVDTMLFIDAVEFPDSVRSKSKFAKTFIAQGPRDRHGRSLRQLDLSRRLFRFPFSYMIYSDQFDALPDDVRAAIYQRLWQVLSGDDPDNRYQKLSRTDRRAIIEILRDTKPGLPAYFR